MKTYKFLQEGDPQALLQWHGWLGDNLGDRARLRRAVAPEDILLTDAFFHFIQQMPEISRHWRSNMLASACVAGALSHVKTHKDKLSFAAQLATPLEGKNKAPMSELRFQQLQKSKTPEDFYRRILRAIQLLDGHVNIVSLANDILHWHRELNHAIDHNPQNRLAVCWATDYFTALKD
jgi:CRISPR system Cascade subunit CasB